MPSRNERVIATWTWPYLESVKYLWSSTWCVT